VDVGLVADDKRGKPIADLKQDEIDLFDNGRKQQLIAFRHATPGAASPAPSTQPSQPSEPTDTFTNTAPTTAQVEDVPDTLILLMDESHLAYLDLNQARAEVLRFLAATRPTSRVALYAISEKGFHVIQNVTQDHALVEKKLAAWIPDAGAVSQAQALERRNRQQFDTVHSTKDLGSVNGNNVDAPETIQTTDPELRQMGDNPLRYALEGMVALARHFAPVPGHKSMAWISGDSVLADWEDQAVGKEKGSKQLEAAIEHTREALNEAHISLYAVDASAVEGGAIDASIQNRNVEVNPVDQNGPIPRNNTAGRTKAQMLQDTRGIQGPVRQLAESTGGRAVNKGGDLKATLDGIDQDSTGLYELGFDPDTSADGKFHTLLVKVPSRKNVVLRYRSGYLYTEESTSTQQRLQQAVWSPQDATAIALTAEAVTAADSASGSSTVKLRIGFPGLALEQKDGHWADNLYIFVAQRDDATQKAEVSGDTLRLSLKQATYESGMPAGIPYRRAVEAKPKLGSVRIIVVDGNSGKMGSVTLPSSALRP
jgi:VWFA-related protein